MMHRFYHLGCLGFRIARNALGVIVLGFLSISFYRMQAASGELALESDSLPDAISVAISPDDQVVAIGNAKGSLTFVNAETGEIFRRVAAHQDWIWSLAYDPAGISLWTVSSDYRAKLWSTDDGSLKRTVILDNGLGPCGKVQSFTFSPDLQLVAGATYDFKPIPVKGTPQTFAQGAVYDLGSGRVQRWLMAPALGCETGSIAFASDGKLLLLAGRDGIIRLFDTQSGSLGRTLPVDGGLNTRAAFSPNGQLIVSSNKDKSFVRLVDALTGREKIVLRGEGPAFAFSPDGRTIATARQFAGVRIWDVQTGTLNADLPLPSFLIFSLVFSRDGKRLAVALGPLSGGVALWDVENKKLKWHIR